MYFTCSPLASCYSRRAKWEYFTDCPPCVGWPERRQEWVTFSMPRPGAGRCCRRFLSLSPSPSVRLHSRSKKHQRRQAWNLKNNIEISHSVVFTWRYVMSLGQYGFSKFESRNGLHSDCVVEQTECEGRLHSNLFITKPLDIKSLESSMMSFDVFNLNLYRLTHLNFSFLPSFKTHRFNYLRSTYGWSGLPPFYRLWSD